MDWKLEVVVVPVTDKDFGAVAGVPTAPRRARSGDRP
jgi:hypothetical protein